MIPAFELSSSRSSIGFSLRSPSLPASEQPVPSSPVPPARQLAVVGAAAVRPGLAVPLPSPFLLTASSSHASLSGQLAQPEPARFFQETKEDQVYVPAQARGAGGVAFRKPPLHPNRANVAGANVARGEAELTGGFMRQIGGKVAGGTEEQNQSSNFRYATHTALLSESSYFSLLNKVTLLSQTQRSLEETILDLGSHNIDLSGRVLDVKQKTAETIQAQEQSMPETFDRLFGRMNNVEKRGAKLEAKHALLEGKIVSVNVKTVKMELEFAGKKEKLDKLKKDVEKKGRLLKWCCVGGLALGVSLILMK